MGLAASQARFLSLTARMSDGEYEAQQISQHRIELTAAMEKYADEYEAAINNKYAVAQVYDVNGNASNVALTWDVINKGIFDGGLGMKLVTASGLIVVPNEEEMNKMIEDSTPESTDPFTEDGTETNITVKPSLTAADFYILEEITDPDVLLKNLQEGNLFFASSKSEQTGDWDKKGIAQVSGVTTKYDNTDDAAAKARYDTKMRKAERQDTMLENRLNQLDTEHQALKTEMDSLQKLIDDNVERDFKTFG